MTPEELLEMLRKIHEPKGFFFNKDQEWVLSILSSILENKERYGYMSCPCRLAAGKKELDRDIICPCAYRADDIREFGSCYCGLYVSPEWNEGKIENRYVPERRPLG